MKIEQRIIEGWGSAREFARVAGHSSSLVCHILAGRRRLTEARAKVWSLLLGVTVKELSRLMERGA